MRTDNLIGARLPVVLYQWHLAVLCFLLSAAGAWGAEPAMGPRVGIGDETAIIIDGRANCAIVYPAEVPEYLALVTGLQESIKAAGGVSIRAYKDTDILAAKYEVADRFKQQNLILLGNLNNNRAMVRIGANFYMYSTCAWPGPDGYELRTVTNPYGTKTNCIILGASDVTGVELALAEFLRVVESSATNNNLMIPRLLRVVVDGEDQAELGGKPLTWGGPMAGTYQFAGACEAYNKSGSPARLQVVRDLTEDLFEAGRAPAANDYGTESAIRGLDLVDTVAMTPEENQTMDNLLLQWVRDVLEKRPYWNPLGRQWSFGGHQACGALSFYAAVNYLLKNGSPNEAARRLLEQKRQESREFLNYLSTSFKDSQKDVGWETWTPLAVPLRYTLAEGDMTVFDSGTATNVVKRHFYAGKGFGPAALVSFVLGDGQFKYLQPEGASLAGWAFVMNGATWMPPPDVRASYPDFLVGTKMMASSPTDWEHAYQASGEGAAKWYTNLPWEKTFHLVGFVDGLGPDDQFAVLGGWDSPGSPGEANSLRVFRQEGHRFLFRADGEDNRQPRPGRFYQNTLVVNSGDYSQPPPCGAELLAHYDGRRVGMVASRLNDYNGVDWDRHVFWRRGKYSAFLDLCTAQKDGPFTITNQWWNSDAPRIEGNSWVAPTGEGTFHLVMADAGSVSSRQWWDGGPYQLRQSKLVTAHRSQQISFYNAFYVDTPRGAQTYEIRKVGPAAMMIRGQYQKHGEKTQEIALMGSGDPTAPTRFGSLSIQTRLFFVSPSAVALEPNDKLTLNGRRIRVSSSGLPNSRDAESLQRALQELWEMLPVGSAEPEGEPGKSVASEVRLSPVTERIPVAGTAYAAIPGVAFTKESDGTLTWDLGRDMKVTRIDGIRFDGDYLPVSCSSDNFGNDVRTVNAQTGVRHHWVVYQYGFGADLGQGTLGPIDQVARYFRIGSPSDKLAYGLWIFESWHGEDWNVTGHNPELFNRPFWQDVIFRSDEPQVQFTRTMAADVDGNDSQEVIASTDNNELLVLDSDGKVRWQQQFDGPITNFICEDMEQDGNREIIAACHDNFVYCFEPNGELRFKLDLTGLQVGLSLSVYDMGQDRRGLVVAMYHGSRKYDHDGTFITGIEGPGFYEDTALPVAEDFNGDGVPDFVIRDNVWGLMALIDGRQLKTVATHGTGYAGKGLAVVPWSLGEGGTTSAVLVIAQQGVAMLSLGPGEGESAGGSAEGVIGGGIEPIFSLPVAPITGWDIADLNGDGRNEIVLSTLYGSVVALDEHGRTLWYSLAGTQAHDVAVIRANDGTPCILVSTGARLMLYDLEGQLLSEQAVEGPPCVKVQALRSGELSRAMCFFADGSVLVVQGHAR